MEVEASSGLHIGPTREFASEHHLSASHAVQNLSSRYITGNHRSDDDPGQRGGSRSAAVTTVPGVVRIAGDRAPEWREDAASRRDTAALREVDCDSEVQL